jgi:hypothetical protein
MILCVFGLRMPSIIASTYSEISYFAGYLLPLLRCAYQVNTLLMKYSVTLIWMFYMFVRCK